MWVLLVILLGLSFVSTVVILSALVLSSPSTKPEKEKVERFSGREALSRA